MSPRGLFKTTREISMNIFLNAEIKPKKLFVFAQVFTTDVTGLRNFEDEHKNAPVGGKEKKISIKIVAITGSVFLLRQSSSVTR